MNTEKLSFDSCFTLDKNALAATIVFKSDSNASICAYDALFNEVQLEYSNVIKSLCAQYSDNSDAIKLQLRDMKKTLSKLRENASITLKQVNENVFSFTYSLNIKKAKIKKAQLDLIDLNFYALLVHSNIDF